MKAGLRIKEPVPGVAEIGVAMGSVEERDPLEYSSLWVVCDVIRTNFSIRHIEILNSTFDPKWL